MSRRRQNRFGVSGDYMSTSAGVKLSGQPTRWREVMTGHRVLTGSFKPSRKRRGKFLTQLRERLVTNTYRPMLARKKEIRRTGEKSAFFRYLLSVIGWFRGR